MYSNGIEGLPYNLIAYEISHYDSDLKPYIQLALFYFSEHLAERKTLNTRDFMVVITSQIVFPLGEADLKNIGEGRASNHMHKGREHVESIEIGKRYSRFFVQLSGCSNCRRLVSVDPPCGQFKRVIRYHRPVDTNHHDGSRIYNGQDQHLRRITFNRKITASVFDREPGIHMDSCDRFQIMALGEKESRVVLAGHVYLFKNTFPDRTLSRQ